MAGRYGNDNLNRFLTIGALVFLVLSMIFGGMAGNFCWTFALAMLIYSYFRMFSRSIGKRQAENELYLGYQRKVTSKFAFYKTRFSQRKTHCFFRCPSCKTTLRVPKGRGKIVITCKNCGTQFEKRT